MPRPPPLSSRTSHLPTALAERSSNTAVPLATEAPTNIPASSIPPPLPHKARGEHAQQFNLTLTGPDLSKRYLAEPHVERPKTHRHLDLQALLSASTLPSCQTPRRRKADPIPRQTPRDDLQDRQVHILHTWINHTLGASLSDPSDPDTITRATHRNGPLLSPSAFDAAAKKGERLKIAKSFLSPLAGIRRELNTPLRQTVRFRMPLEDTSVITRTITILKDFAPAYLKVAVFSLADSPMRLDLLRRDDVLYWISTYLYATTPEEETKDLEEKTLDFFLRLFSLLLFLDQAFLQCLLPRRYRLFHRNSSRKRTPHVLRDLLHTLMPEAGNFTERLRLQGYTLSCIQAQVDDHPDHVGNLRTDLRDGVHLCRLYDSLRPTSQPLALQLHFPSNTESNRLLNLHLFLTAVSEPPLGIPVKASGITPELIAMGSREVTLSLLWLLLLNWHIPSLVDVDRVHEEIRRLNGSSKSAANSKVQLYFKEPTLNALLSWCQAATARMNPSLSVRNFTSSFADASVPCYLLALYMPSLLSPDRIHTTARLQDMQRAFIAAEEDPTGSSETTAASWDIPSTPRRSAASSSTHHRHPQSMPMTAADARGDPVRLAWYMNIVLLRKALASIEDVPSLVEERFPESPDEKSSILLVAYLCWHLLTPGIGKADPPTMAFHSTAHPSPTPADSAPAPGDPSPSPVALSPPLPTRQVKRKRSLTPYQPDLSPTPTLFRTPGLARVGHSTLTDEAPPWEEGASRDESFLMADTSQPLIMNDTSLPLGIANGDDDEEERIRLKEREKMHREEVEREKKEKEEYRERKEEEEGLRKDILRAKEAKRREMERIRLEEEDRKGKEIARAEETKRTERIRLQEEERLHHERMVREKAHAEELRRLEREIEREREMARTEEEERIKRELAYAEEVKLLERERVRLEEEAMMQRERSARKKLRAEDEMRQEKERLRLVEEERRREKEERFRLEEEERFRLEEEERLRLEEEERLRQEEAERLRQEEEERRREKEREKRSKEEERRLAEEEVRKAQEMARALERERRRLAEEKRRQEEEERLRLEEEEREREEEIRREKERVRLAEEKRRREEEEKRREEEREREKKRREEERRLAEEEVRKAQEMARALERERLRLAEEKRRQEEEEERLRLEEEERERERERRRKEEERRLAEEEERRARALERERERLRKLRVIINLQACTRGYLERERFFEVREAAITIQSMWRGYLVRREVIKQAYAAYDIQQVWKAYVFRRNLERHRRVIISLQAEVRGWLVRREVRKAGKAAMVIQMWWRRCQFQAACEARRVREKRRRIAILTRLQAHVRGHLVRWECRWWLNRREEAAITLQAGWRGKQGRAEGIERYGAVLTFQSFWRAKQERKRFLALRQAVRIMEERRVALLLGRQTRAEMRVLFYVTIYIQRLWRRRQEAREIRSVFLEVREAAITIQAAYRGRLVRDRYLEVQWAVQEIQGWWRGRVAVIRAKAELQRLWEVREAERRLVRETEVRMIREALEERRREEERVRLAEEEEEEERLREEEEEEERLREIEEERLRWEEEEEQREVQIAERERWMRLEQERISMREGEERWEAAILIQRWWRWVLEGQDILYHERLSKIQAIWRGHLVRRAASRRVQEARLRVEEANAEATEDMFLWNRTSVALDILMDGSLMSDVLGACIHLEVVTRLSHECRLRLLRHGIIGVIYKTINSLNQSIPHQATLQAALAALSNFSLDDETATAVLEEYEHAVEILLQLLHRHRHSPDVLEHCATILHRLVVEMGIREPAMRTRNVVKRLRSVVNLVSRSYRMERVVGTVTPALRRFHQERWEALRLLSKVADECEP